MNPDELSISDQEYQQIFERQHNIDRLIRAIDGWKK